MENLEDSVIYNNLPEFYVSVTNLNPEWGTITSGSGDHQVRVTDKFVLNFEVNDGYYFEKWLVVNKNNSNEEIADCIEFEYPQNKSANAVAKVLQQNESMMIVPFCRECLYVESYYPNESDLIYPKNSSITVNFNYDIPADRPENDVSQISIKVTGIPNALEYFKTPVIIGNKIIISSKNDKKIPVSAGEVKVVTVSIPETFVCCVNGEYLTLGKQFIFSYSIDSSTETKASIVFTNSDDKNAYFAADEIAATGVPGMYNIGQIIKLSYRPTPDYKFTVFNSSDEQSVVIGEVTYDSFTGCYNADATVINTKRDENGTVVNVVINPVVQKLYKLSVQVQSKNGKSTPVIDTSYYNGESFNVTFNADSDFGFTGWKYFLNGKEFVPSSSEIVSVTDISTDTYYSEIELKVEKEPEENQVLVITPECVKRPKIVSATPLYDTEGVYRDRKISIMFDTALSEDSLYYSKDELIALGVWNAEKDKVADGYTLLDKDDSKKYFGYQKTGDDDSIVWKAISITKRTKSDENLLKYYAGPEFDTNDTSVLRISANSEPVKMPPVATDILVKVNTNLGINVEYKKGKTTLIPLTSEYSWNYFTNSLYDNEKPKITELSLYTVKEGNTKFKDEIDKNTVLFRHKDIYPEGEKGFSCDDFKTTVKESKNIAAYNLSEGKVWIQAKVTDGGSGPKSLSATITKVTGNDFYPEDSDKKVEGISYTAKLNITGSVALTYCDNESNGEFFDVSSLDQGLYKMTFTAMDKNEKESDSMDAYFIYDKTGPAYDEEAPKVTCVRSESEKTAFSWTNPNEADLWKVEVYTQETNDGTLKDWNETSYSIETYERNDSDFTINTRYTKIVENLVNGTKYQHKVLFYDYAGNFTEKVLDIDNTAPTLKTSITECRKEAGKTTLSYALNESDYWKAEVYTQKLPEGANTLQEWQVDTAELVERPSDYTAEVLFGNEVSGLDDNKLVDGHKYQHKVVLVDYAGNKSEPIDVEIDNTSPEVEFYIGSLNQGIRICNDTLGHKDIDYYVTISGSDSGTITDISDDKSNSIKFTGKTNKTSYSYSVQAVDFSGNKSDVVTLTGKAGIEAGNYCYLINNQDIIFSNDILNDGENLVGIVISDSIDSTSKVETAKILRITVDENKSVVYNHPNTAVYDNTYGAGVDNQTDHGEIFYQSIVNNNKLEDFPKIKHLYYDVNNENKNIITWYLPGLNELLPLNGYWSGPSATINTSLSKIPSSIKHMGWLGDGMSEMVSCTFNNSNASTPKFSVAYFTNSTYKYYELKSYPTHATNSLLMARINPAY